MAAEEAKKRLSFEPYAAVREESLVTIGGKPLHLELELSRGEYEEMILPSLESTMESVSAALVDAHKTPGEIDAVLLVGGSTRTPMVSELLEERLGQRPRQDLHPDLCVALGAGVLASRLGGEEVSRVLVDVSPFSFGPSFLGELDGRPYHHCYRPVIRRNTPLPVTRTEPYFTAFPRQTRVEVEIYQGENHDALKNILVGEFHLEGLTSTYEPVEVLCRMSLDLDGILKVSGIEKDTGNAVHITINNALAARTEAEMAAARERLDALYGQRPADQEQVFQDTRGDAPPDIDGAPPAGRQGEDLEVTGADVIDVDFEAAPAAPVTEPATAGGERPDAEWEQACQRATTLVERVRSRLDGMHPEDKEEAIELNAQAVEAMAAGDRAGLEEAAREIRELLFFIEGK